MLKFNRRNKRLVIPVGINPSYNINVAELYNVSDADVEANDILEGKIAYGKDGKIVGTLDVQSEKEESYQEGYEFGYNEGNNAGYRLGYDEGNEAGITEQKSKLESITITENGSYNREDGWNSVVVDVPDLNGDYNEGVEAGIEIGKAEIIEGMNDATITAGTVFKGDIGYGKDGERIVGEFEYVEGFDFGKIGYNQTLSNELNRDTAATLAYSKQLMDGWNTSTTNASYYFQNDSSLVYAPLVDTSKVTNMGYLFNGCPNLKVIPDYNYDKVTNMQNFCSYSANSSLNLDLKSCTNAKMIASYNSGVMDVSINFNNTECNCYGLVYECTNLSSATLSNVIISDSRSIFYSCSKLQTLNVNNVKFGGNIQECFSSCSNLTTLPLLDFENVTGGGGYLYAYPFYSCTKLTNIGGFQNCGKSFSGSGVVNVLMFGQSRVLTRQSCLNIFNTIYDMNLNTSYTGNPSIQLSTETKALLSDEDIAIATSKGWTIS